MGANQREEEKALSGSEGSHGKVKGTQGTKDTLGQRDGIQRELHGHATGWYWTT